MSTEQYHLPLPTQESLAAEDFFPSDSNREAVRWVLETPPEAWPAPTMILFGPAGCGKTHLLAIWRERFHALTPSAETDETLSRLVNDPASVPALTLDDADRWAGNPAAEETLQHFYNAARAAQKPFLLAARTPPAAWGLQLADIASRLKSCPTAVLHEPDDDLMRGLLIKQFADRQLRVEDGVIEYLAKRLDRTGQAVRDAVATLDRQALAEGHKISIPFAQGVLFS